jgi:DNA-binding NtrC family response regulator
VREKRFRADLYFRINTVVLRMPPLRERVQDIVPLGHAILDRIGSELGRPGLRFDADALAALTSYSWPGNVRELKNLIERAVLLCEGPVLTRHDLRFEAGANSPVVDSAGMTLEQMERAYIERVLLEEHGRVERAALRLGIPRSTLYHKLKTFGIPCRLQKLTGRSDVGLAN